MLFSGGEILVQNNEVILKHFEDNEFTTSIFAKSDYKELALLKFYKKVEINRWILLVVTFVIAVAWVALSEYFASIKENISEFNYQQFHSLDNIVMPALLFLFFLTLFVDVIANVKFIRFIFGAPFMRRKYQIIFVLITKQEIKVNVRNKKEAQMIIDLIEVELYNGRNVVEGESV
ncbi:MAG: hypothetical protein H6600_02015 [Flavobacteriales bacterium]|nr:hypothetical protein [Flavobacteriales bacterium]MCB9197206.1 hypothetical protein [Flavobacteriales bacterium]